MIKLIDLYKKFGSHPVLPGLNLEITGSVNTDGDREGLQRAALDREIRQKIWTTLRESQRATNSVDQIVVTPDERAHWVNKLYGEAVADNKQAVQLATRLYTEGQTDFLNVLIAQRSLYTAQDALVQSERTVATDLVAIYKALGGGWENEPPIPPRDNR